MQPTMFNAEPRADTSTGSASTASSLFSDFAALFEYPSQPLGGICAAAIADCAGLDPLAGIQIAAFAADIGQLPLADLQELYTRTFDFDKDAALYVGHQLFGEDGRRGLLIAGLVERYRTVGLDPGTELADHFSPVLRSLAIDSTSDEARELVRYALLPAIAKAAAALEQRAPAYAALLAALVTVLGARAELEPWTSSSLPFSRTSR